MVERSLSMREVPGSIPGASISKTLEYTLKIIYLYKTFQIEEDYLFD